MDLSRLPELNQVMDHYVRGKWAITGSVALTLTMRSLLQSGVDKPRMLKFLREPGDIDILIARGETGYACEFSKALAKLEERGLYEFDWSKVNLSHKWRVVRVPEAGAPFHGEFLRAGRQFGQLTEADNVTVSGQTYPVVNPYALLNRKLSIIKTSKNELVKSQIDLGPVMRVLEPWLLRRSQTLVPPTLRQAASKQAFETLRNRALRPDAHASNLADIDGLIRRLAAQEYARRYPPPALVPLGQ